MGGIGLAEADDKIVVLSFLVGLTNVGRKLDVDGAIDNTSKVDLAKALFVGYEPDEVLGVIEVVVFKIVDVLFVSEV